MIYCARTTAIGSVLGIVLFALVNNAHAQDDALDGINGELANDANNPILQMQQQMLLHKNDEQLVPTPNWRWMQRRTNLRREVAGRFSSIVRRGSFAQSAALLTGQRAIDESLQLGSIGVNQSNDDSEDWLSIDEIEFVDIESHPWTEMVAGKDIAIPDIANLIPDDVLFVHMIQPDKFLEFEGVVQEQADLLGDVYRLGDITGMKAKITERLGIPDADALIAAVEEMAFVSDDLSFTPRTDYAVVLKLVNRLAEKGLGFIIGDKAIHRRVGDYMVVATDEGLITRIEHAHKNTNESMFGALDYHYALLKMEPRRDGLIYLSEAFIRKLTGPAYRINARRRNTILDALETLQYTVFAYRRITGRWPASIHEIAAANYIADDAVYAPENYSVGGDGRVSHAIWGSLWQVTPLGRVPLNRISAAEKINYEQFSTGYQSFFTEFFDPISIAYTITDQLYLHTLILPLINNSDYRELQSFFGRQPGEFSILFDPDRLGAANIAAKFSIDDLLLLGMSAYRRPPQENETAAALRERLIYEAENEIAKEVLGESLDPGERLLDFMGDEVIFGVGERNSFSVSNIADIDIWFGLKLNDRDRAEAFFRRLWQKVSAQFGGRGGGLLQLSSTEPLSNEYKGQQFYLLPTGFVNIFYVFFDDVFYLTISQLAMNRLIDARLDSEAEVFSNNLQRGFAHVGKTHNIIAALDLEKIAAFELGTELNFWGKQVATQLKSHQDTLREAMTLAKLLPDYDGSLSNVSGYYRDLPKDFYGAQFDADAGELYLTIEQQRKPLFDISANSRGGELAALLASSLPSENLRARVRAFRSATLGLSFVPEGLDVKLSIGNPKVSKPDSRFTFDHETRGAGAVGALLLMCATVAILRRRRSGQLARKKAFF